MIRPPHPVSKRCPAHFELPALDLLVRAPICRIDLELHLGSRSHFTRVRYPGGPGLKSPSSFLPMATCASLRALFALPLEVWL